MSEKVEKQNKKYGNQYVPDPRQQLFLKYWLDPREKTFSNAYKSALKAGYGEEYAKNITGQNPDWLSEYISTNSMLLKAVNNLNKFLDNDEDAQYQWKATELVARTIGKKQFSEKSPLEDKDGNPIQIIIKQ